MQFDKKRKTAILLSIFSLMGMGGIGHIYLGKIRQGVLLLISGLLLVNVLALAIIAVVIFLGDADTEIIEIGGTSLMVVLQAIYFVGVMIHIIHITKKQ